MSRTTLACLLSAGLCACLIATVTAQQTQPDEPQADAAPTTQPADDAEQRSAEDVLNEMLNRREENPIIQPARPAPQISESTYGQGVGTAPGARKSVKLMREGQFVLNRRGRMTRTTEGMTGWLFTFDADSDGLADPPMHLMPCKMLEDMESIITEQGEDAPFTISGQVFVYRNANYLLPTLMQLAPKRGNLQP